MGNGTKIQSIMFLKIFTDMYSTIHYSCNLYMNSKCMHHILKKLCLKFFILTQISSKHYSSIAQALDQKQISMLRLVNCTQIFKKNDF